MGSSPVIRAMEEDILRDYESAKQAKDFLIQISNDDTILGPADLTVKIIDSGYDVNRMLWGLTLLTYGLGNAVAMTTKQTTTQVFATVLASMSRD